VYRALKRILHSSHLLSKKEKKSSKTEEPLEEEMLIERG